MLVDPKYGINHRTPWELFSKKAKKDPRFSNLGVSHRLPLFKEFILELKNQ